MSKKDDGEQPTRLAGKIADGKKKSSQRRQRLEKRSRRRTRKSRRSNIIDHSQKHRNGSNGGRHGSAPCAVPTSVLPPLCWSSASLMCHLRSAHTGRRNCLDRPWTWSATRPAASTTILLDDNQRILFHPRTSSSTQVVLADRPLPSTGKHYWEIYMPAVYGTSIMFGIATNRQQLISSAFTNLIGLDQHGWGLSHQGVLWHNGTSRQYLPQPIEPLGALLIGLEFDGDARTLSYVVNNQPAGVAFRDLPRDVMLYPAVSSTSAQSTMILKHRCKICSSLREICVKRIRSSEWGTKINGELLPSHLRQQLIE